MSKTLHFRNLRIADRWRKRHHKRRVTGVTVTSNRPIKKQKHHPLTMEQRIVAYCHQALEFAGKMTYTETARRSELFHRKPGDFTGAHADCSQFGASILHWLGNKKVNDHDFTGTLLEKAKIVSMPAPGRGVIWGPGAGAHFAWVTEKAGAHDWWTVGFGHQGAPDRVLLSQMDAYFKSAGQPGVRFLDFTR